MPQQSPASLDESRHEEFVRLLSASKGRIFAFIFTLIPRRADAEELVQDVSIVLWRKFQTFRAEDDFVRWACGIAYLEVLHFLRSRSREERAISEVLLSKLRDHYLNQQTLLDDRRSALDECLKKLCEKDRNLIDHYYFRGKVTAAEVASAIDRSVAAVYKSLERIRLTLHRCIESAATEDRR